MNIAKIVDPDRGLIARQIFIDRGVYDEELNKVFSRSWLYLGHESQLLGPHSYFTTYMGEDPILVARDLNGRIRAFLNSCRHRGMLICLSSEGQSAMFRCPYHGWTYSSDGKLVNLPRYDTAYYGELDKDQWGLIEVSRIESYCGMLFATWDAEAPALKDYLGDMAFYIELLANRVEGGLEVIGGTQRFTLPANWKLIAENFAGDPSHVGPTHASSIATGFRDPLGEKGHCVYLQNGHSVSGEAGGVLRGQAIKTAYSDFLETVRTNVASKKGEAATRLVPIGVGVIFPNFCFIDSPRYRMFRICHPRGPSATDVYSWCFVDKALPNELKDSTRRQFVLSFGASGLFEVDDAEVLQGCMAGIQSRAGRKYPLNYQQGLAHDNQPASDYFGGQIPGRMGERFFTEANMRNFYRRWVDLMNAND